MKKNARFTLKDYTDIKIFLLFLLDNTFRTEWELRQALELPVLGIIPAVEGYSNKAARSDKGKGA